MSLALKLARRRLGRTSPNPVVGAVLVKDGRVVGEGYHRAAGEPHAEVEAIRSAGSDARGAELFVTLEPCNHHGRTPPCTSAILEAGIKKVWYGIDDPNPVVRGGGADTLRDAGVEVVGQVMESRCRRINEVYLTNVTLPSAVHLSQTCHEPGRSYRHPHRSVSMDYFRSVPEEGSPVEGSGIRDYGGGRDRIGGQSVPDNPAARGPRT